MATLAGRPGSREMTVEEFLDLPIEGRAELENGVLYLMAGGSFGHALVSANIIAALGPLLKGSGCRPMTPDFAVRTGPATVRMPDASVYCDLPTTDEGWKAKLWGDPRVVFEVLSPSTRSLDLSIKLDEYKSLQGTHAIVLVDPDSERIRLVERTGPEAWTDQWLPQGSDVPLTSLGITLPHAEIFARA